MCVWEGVGKHKTLIKVSNFYLQALSANGWSPKERWDKQSTSPVEPQVVFEPGTFGPQSNALTTRPQVTHN